MIRRVAATPSRPASGCPSAPRRDQRARAATASAPFAASPRPPVWLRAGTIRKPVRTSALVVGEQHADRHRCHGAVPLRGEAGPHPVSAFFASGPISTAASEERHALPDPPPLVPALAPIAVEAGGRSRAPSSVTSTSIALPARSATGSKAFAPGGVPQALVSASCTMRYAVSPHRAGAGTGAPRRATSRAVRWRPACASSPSSSEIEGCGAGRFSVAGADPPSRRRSSPSAARPLSSMWRSLPRAPPPDRHRWQPRAPRGLHDYHAEVVRDELVQLAREPRALFSHGFCARGPHARRSAATARRSSLCSLARRRRDSTPRPPTGRPPQAQRTGTSRSDAAPREILGDCGEHQREGQEPADDRRPALGVGPDRVETDRHGENRGNRILA